ncbi:MAG: hypothetical protein AAGF87_19005 [Bacteroidota bacterium]
MGVIGARLYAAEVGQGFLSVDPLAQDFAGWSGYNYVLGNPIVLTDPDGRFPIVPLIGGLIGAGFDYGTQVVSNLAKGDGWSSFTNVDGSSILASGIAGATGAGLVNLANKGRKIVTLSQRVGAIGTEAAIDGSVSAGHQLATEGNVSIETTITSVLTGAAVRSPVRDEVIAARQGRQNSLDGNARTAERYARNAENRLNPTGDRRPRGRAGKVARLNGEAAAARESSSSFRRQTVIRSTAAGVSTSNATTRIINSFNNENNNPMGTSDLMF